MKCNDCRYLGIVFDHLKYYNGIAEWKACTYPLPYHVEDRAIPMGIEHNCEVYKKKEVEG